MALKELGFRYAIKRAKDYKLTDGEGLYVPAIEQSRRAGDLVYTFGRQHPGLTWEP